MNQKILWGVTAVAALLMIGGAVLFVRQGVQQSPSIIKEGEVLAVAPAPQPVAPVPVAAPSVTPVAPTPKTVESQGIALDEVAVDISRIAGTLKVTSPDIPAIPHQEIPRYPLDLTCYRKSRAPGLVWQGAPATTKSYIVALERRVPGEKAGWTWVLYNIPADKSSVPSGVNPASNYEAVWAVNMYGNPVYTGPCEPKGVFLYVLRLFALDQVLDVPAGASWTDIVPLMKDHVVDAAEIRAQHYNRM